MVKKTPPTLILSSSGEIRGEIRPETEEGKVRREIDFLKLLMAGVIIVLLVGFVTLILDYYYTRATIFQDLVNKINEQNIKIDLLFEELRQTNSKLLEIEQ